MSMRDKLHTGELYLPNDDSILEEQFGYVNRLYDFNMTRPTELEKREKILKELFAEIGEGCYIEPPLRANSVGHFLRTVQYMPVCFAPCSCVSFPFLEPFLSFFCTLGNTLILQSGEHIQHRTPYNS